MQTTKVQEEPVVGFFPSKMKLEALEPFFSVDETKTRDHALCTHIVHKSIAP